MIFSEYREPGQILDGRNRWKAAQDAGVEPTRIEYEGDDPLGYVVRHNLNRRHLNASQRAVIGLEVEEYEAQRARERMATSAPGLYGGKPPVEIFPQAVNENCKARDFAAKAVGANPRYIQDAKRIKATAPELLPKIAAGREWEPPLYDVWTAARASNKVQHFGMSEASFVDNLLYRAF